MPKRIAPLADMQVSKAKAREKQYTLFDGGGLFLLVSPSGGKLWRFKYSFEGKARLISLGTYPEISLAVARQRRGEARELVAKGVDPGLVKKAALAAGQDGEVNSFEVVAREWHGRFACTWVESHAQNKLLGLEKNVFPWLGSRTIAEVTAPDVLAVLRRLEERGLLDTAHRLRFDIGAIFRYAIATGRAERDPAADLRGALPPVKSGHYAAITDPQQVAPLLRAIDGFQGSFVVKCALQLAPLLFVRPGELRAAEWSEIDLAAGEWNIPAEKMKMKVAHLVPLPCQAVQILRDLQPLTKHSKYVFPCHRSPLRCMSENAVNAGLRRMGYEKKEITGHGFRAMARTILDEVLHFRVDYIEHQLAHAVKDPLGRAYNRTSHLPERRTMMQVWADYLDGIKNSI